MIILQMHLDIINYLQWERQSGRRNPLLCFCIRAKTHQTRGPQWECFTPLKVHHRTNKPTFDVNLLSLNVSDSISLTLPEKWCLKRVTMSGVSHLFSLSANPSVKLWFIVCYFVWTLIFFNYVMQVFILNVNKDLFFVPVNILILL